MEDIAGVVAWASDNALLLITAVFLPLLNGLVTRIDARDWVKSVTNFALAFLATLADQLAAGDGHFAWQAFLATWMIVAGISHNVYKMVWKPAGGGEDDPVRVNSPGTGIG